MSGPLDEVIKLTSSLKNSEKLVYSDVEAALSRLKAPAAGNATLRDRPVEEVLIGFNFTQNFQKPVEKLSEYMRDVLNFEGNQRAINDFLEIHKKHRPLELVYDLLILVRNDAINPLRPAIADPPSTAVFGYWAARFNEILGTLLYVEVFASRLAKNEDNYDLEKMQEKAKQVMDEVEKLKKIVFN